MLPRRPGSRSDEWVRAGGARPREAGGVRRFRPRRVISASPISMPNLEPNLPPPRRVTPLEMPAVPRDGLRFPLTRDQLVSRVREALEEDGAFNDITTIATVRSDRRARAALVARQGGTIAGTPLAPASRRLVAPHAAT